MMDKEVVYYLVDGEFDQFGEGSIPVINKPPKGGKKIGKRSSEDPKYLIHVYLRNSGLKPRPSVDRGINICLAHEVLDTILND